MFELRRSRSKYSVVIFVYKGIQLKPCLARILKQKETPKEIIFLTKTSTSKTSEIIENFKQDFIERNIDTKIKQTPNLDNQLLINLVMRESHGKNIIFIDEYCFVSPRWLKYMYVGLKTGFIVNRIVKNNITITNKTKIAWIGISIRKFLLKRLRISRLSKAVKNLYESGYRPYCKQISLITYVQSSKFLNKEIHYPFWYVCNQTKKLDSFWTVLVLDPIAVRLTWLIANFTSITPNQVTFLSALFGVVSAYFFLQATHINLIAGAFFLTCCHLLDCVDGKLARTTKTESKIGGFTDIIKDRIIVVLNIYAIGFGKYMVFDRTAFIYVGTVLLLLGSYVRLFTFYYSSIKKARSINRKNLYENISQESAVSKVIRPPIWRLFFSLRNYLHSRRIKIVPHIYDLEMMAFVFGAVLNQMRIIFIGVTIIVIIILFFENSLRITMLIKFSKKNDDKILD